MPFCGAAATAAVAVPWRFVIGVPGAAVAKFGSPVHSGCVVSAAASTSAISGLVRRDRRRVSDGSATTLRQAFGGDGQRVVRHLRGRSRRSAARRRAAARPQRVGERPRAPDRDLVAAEPDVARAVAPGRSRRPPRPACAPTIHVSGSERTDAAPWRRPGSCIGPLGGMGRRGERRQPSSGRRRRGARVTGKPTRGRRHSERARRVKDSRDSTLGDGGRLHGRLRRAAGLLRHSAVAARPVLQALRAGHPGLAADPLARARGGQRGRRRGPDDRRPERAAPAARQAASARRRTSSCSSCATRRSCASSASARGPSPDRPLRLPRARARDDAARRRPRRPRHHPRPGARGADPPRRRRALRRRPRPHRHADGRAARRDDRLLAGRDDPDLPARAGCGCCGRSWSTRRCAAWSTRARRRARRARRRGTWQIPLAVLAPGEDAAAPPSSACSAHARSRSATIRAVAPQIMASPTS